MTKGLKHLMATHFWAKILAGLMLGIVTGILMGPTFDLVPESVTSTLSNWLALPGQLFLALVQMVVIPLIFASIVRGIASGESIQQLKTLGIRVGLYYVATTLIAVTIGIATTQILQPGKYLDKKAISKIVPMESAEVETPEPIKRLKLGEVIPSLLTQNPFGAMVNGQMMQVVLLAMFMGIALMALSNENAKPLLDLLNSLQQVSMVVIHWAMHLAPIAVFGLMARLLSQIGWNAMVGLGAYVATVVIGLSLVLVVYLILAATLGKIKPWTFMRAARDAQLLAFSTSSSAAVMPLTIETAEKKLGVRSSVAQFIIPLGTTINMDGTALYQGAATIFLAQVFNVDLSLGQLLLVVTTATVSSIGAPGTPGVGIAILSMILANVGIPANGIVLIVAVDRILDMCRTVINVSGDLTAAAVIDKTLSRQ
jgi:Na+/H+-dicarboxylate symporter